MSRTCDANLMSYALLATAFLCNFHFMYEDTWRYIDFSFNAALHTLESLTPRTWRPPPARWCQSYLTIRVGSGMCKLIPVAIKIGMHRISTGAGFCTPGLYIYISTREMFHKGVVYILGLGKDNNVWKFDLRFLFLSGNMPANSECLHALIGPKSWLLLFVARGTEFTIHLNDPYLRFSSNIHCILSDVLCCTISLYIIHGTIYV